MAKSRMAIFAIQAQLSVTVHHKLDDEHQEPGKEEIPGKGHMPHAEVGENVAVEIEQQEKGGEGC